MATIKRFRFDTLTPEGYRSLLRTGGLSNRHFMYLTGRHYYDIENFLHDKPNAKWQPSMAEILVLELVARNPQLKAAMMEIAQSYSNDGLPPPDDRHLEAKVERSA